jgi:hypothetical protein
VELTLDYWIEPGLMVSLQYEVERHAERISRLGALLDELASLRNAVSAARIPSAPRALGVYAVDSSYTSPPLELVGGVFAVVAYGYVGIAGGGQDRFVSGALYFSDSREADLSRFSAILERRLATRLLDAKLRGSKRLDVLIVDGDIALHPLPYNLAVRGGKYEEVNRVMDRMLRAAQLSRTGIVGIAKRVRSRYLSVVAGRCLPANDKVAASVMLRPGEYFSLGRLRDVLPRWAEIHYAECERGQACNREGGAARGADRLCRRLAEFNENFARVLESQEYPHLRHLGDIEIVYYVPPGRGIAVRAEILDLGGLGTDAIVAFLAHTASPMTGYPQILDAVDQYVRVSPELAAAVLTALASRVPARLSYITWPANMQKALAWRL